MNRVHYTGLGSLVMKKLNSLVKQHAEKGRTWAQVQLGLWYLHEWPQGLCNRQEGGVAMV